MAGKGQSALESCQAPPAAGGSAPRRRLVIVAYPGVTLLDVAGPAQVFAALPHETPQPRFHLEVSAVSAVGGMMPTDAGMTIGSRRFAELPDGPVDTLIVPGGPGVWRAMEDPLVVQWIADAARRSRRVAAVCLGAFLLGRAGLLDGRRAVTHWRYCERLAYEFPLCRVRPNSLFQRDGAIWTSAGVSAGIDLALAMVEEDHGHPLALAIARRLVVFLKRPGGQDQFSTLLRAQVVGTDARIDALHEWIGTHLHEDLRVEALAARVGMSPRSFARLYATCTGLTPAATVERMRVEAARLLLETTRSAVLQIAHTVGFGDDERMRRAFLRQLGVTPATYRARFSARAPA